MMSMRWDMSELRTSAAVSIESLARLVDLAREAGTAAMAHYETVIPFELKSDRTPVTAADLAANRVIVDGLRRWDRGVPIVSEEGVPAHAVTDATFWLVDPIDGTKEFLRRNGQFTVNIALIDAGEPVLGVVHAPALCTTYFAARGSGAWRQTDDSPAERVFSTPPAEGEKLVVVESQSHPSPDLESYLARLPVARRIQMGSSLKFCLVADGTAHIYPRLGPTMEWDVAAGDCVFRNSGRTRPRGSPLAYGKPGFRNGPFVVGIDGCAGLATL